MTLAKTAPRASIKIRGYMVDATGAPRVLSGSCSALAGVAMSKRATGMSGSMINCAVLENMYNRMMMMMNASPPATAASRVLGRAAIGKGGMDGPSAVRRYSTRRRRRASHQCAVAPGKSTVECSSSRSLAQAALDLPPALRCGRGEPGCGTRDRC